MAKQNKSSPVQLAAQIYGCHVQDLLSYREYEDGSVVIVAPNGQKFTYSAQSIIEYALSSAEGSRPATSEHPAEQLSCFPKVLGSAAPVTKKKHKAAEHTKAKDAK